MRSSGRIREKENSAGKGEVKVSFNNTVGSPQGILCFAFKLTGGDRMIPPGKA